MSENGERALAVPATMPPMTLDPNTCYRALKARDARFDGRFFVGVATTRIATSHSEMVAPSTSWLRRRRGVSAHEGGSDFGFTPGGLAADLISAIEARALWSRFGF